MKVERSDHGDYYIKGLEEASPVFYTRKAAQEFLDERMWEGLPSMKHCLFQYATDGQYMNVKIYEDTDLITWEEAVTLWEKYKKQFIKELEDGLRPEMVIWTGCKDTSDYHTDAFHIDYTTPVENGEFVKRITEIIDPTKVTMGEPV